MSEWSPQQFEIVTSLDYPDFEGEVTKRLQLGWRIVGPIIQNVTVVDGVEKIRFWLAPMLKD